MAPHSSTLAWKIPWTEEAGRLQSMRSLGVGHDWVTSLSVFTFIHWRRKWKPTPVFLPGESQGRGSLVGCRLWGRTVGHDWSDLAAAAAAHFLCSMWAKNISLYFSMVYKHIKRIVFYDMKVLWNSNFCGFQQSFIGTQPCLSVCTVYAATFVLWGQSWIAVTQTIWPTKALTIYYLALYGKILSNSGSSPTILELFLTLSKDD